jgi:sphinganine-1-phosphate aldolase
MSSGYTESAKTIIGAARHFAEQIRTQPRFSDISVIGDPKLSVVAVGSRDPSLNIYGVADRMSKKGWHLNAIAEPPGVHMAFTVSLVFMSLN